MDAVVHIGTEKTGTTLLQQWLYANIDELSRQGIFLSNLVGRLNNRKLVECFNTRFDKAFWKQEKITTPEQKWRALDGLGDAYRAEITKAAASHHTAVITSEHFHSRLIEDDDVMRFGEFCRETFARTRIICYLRPQWKVRTSLYSTVLQWTDDHPPVEKFHANPHAYNKYYNYLELYDRWARAFGADNLIFRIYDRDGFTDGDLRRDFLASLDMDVDADRLDFSITSANESMKYLKARAFVGINKTLPRFTDNGVDARNAMFKRLIGKLAFLDRGEIHDDLARRYHDAFRDSNNELARRCFGRDTLFEEPQPVAARKETLSLEETGDIVEQLVAAMAEDVRHRMMNNDDAEQLRDIALKFETGTPLSRDDAINLMALAARAKPEGGFIRKKLHEWRKAKP